MQEVYRGRSGSLEVMVSTPDEGWLAERWADLAGDRTGASEVLADLL